MARQSTDPWDLDAAYAWLNTLAPAGIRLGLDRVLAALDALGTPQDRLRIVTVAGTNGKGSTASFLASIAHTAGVRVGLYTSPHLVRVTERIKVGGVPILPHEFVAWTKRVRVIVEGVDGPQGAGPIPLTFFEALTVMAYGYFAEREVDLAVMEVGLGGRLDATNIAAPEVAIITPVDLDHQGYLGNTRVEIAREKAGIIHAGSTVVTNIAPELFHTVVGPRAFKLRASIRRAGVDFQHRWVHGGFRYRGWIHRLGPVSLGLRGTHQGDNAALACAAAETLCGKGFAFKAFEIAEGLRRARHPGRLERRRATVDAEGRLWPALLLDGAHNPHAAAMLAEEIVRTLPERPRILLYASRPDKDIRSILRSILPHVDGVILTSAPSVPMIPERLAERIARPLGCEVARVPELHRALELARELAGPEGGLLIAGSLYLLGAALPSLPIPTLDGRGTLDSDAGAP